jgi:hypothetical protein
LPPFGGGDPREAESQVLGMLIDHLGMVRSSAIWIESAIGYQYAGLVDAKDA